MNTHSPKRLDLLCREPFRIFFPWAFLVSALGVMLWPLYFYEFLPFYPLEAHARLMVLGFAGSMITGFLGTAGPRLLGSAPWCRFELLHHALLSVLMVGCLLFNKIVLADLLTGFWLVGVMGSFLFRLLLDRHDCPPPGVPLAMIGLAGAALAGIALSMHPILRFPPSLYAFWRLLYFQGLLWLPILGVAPYLLPRFFGKSSRHSFEESLSAPKGWHSYFWISCGAGTMMIGSFVVEAWISGPAGMIFRCLVVSLYLYFSIPGLFSLEKTNGLAWSLRWVIPCALGGWLLASLFPGRRVGMLHLMFIGSAGLLMLAAATRVTLGHYDRHDRLATPLRWFHPVTALILLTAATRLTSDFILSVRTSHFTYAAVLWIFLLVFWRRKIRWELRQEREDEGLPRRKCPRRSKISANSS